ncbi:uncharacterized protein CDAR_391531 [Caerostris darwini]|uniref:Uncharacterized protein n=1 Tax=Caerostris darwini TaxID=1538125 RepID=A0AAV4RUJ1_9ARAC|nr:uncharacterized protein CDAR_391531 [Caerostris darwini]
MKAAANILGLFLLWVLIVGRGKAQEVDDKKEVDQEFAASQNSLTALTALLGNQLQQSATVQRRLSLEDFFLNRNAQEAGQPEAQQEPQFQVQQNDPNSILLTRDTQLPTGGSGMISRLLLARRMLRLRRMARRLILLPRLLRFARLRPIRQAIVPRPIGLLSRMGQMYDPYDPRDYVFGNKGYSHNDSASSYENEYGRKQQQQGGRNYGQNIDPYDFNYDLVDLQKAREANNYQLDSGNKIKRILTMTFNKKIQEQLLLLQKLQQQQQLPNSHTYERNPQEEDYQSQQQEYNNPTDHKHDSHANQHHQGKYESEEPESDQYSQAPKSNHHHQAQIVNDDPYQLPPEEVLRLLNLQAERQEKAKLLALQKLQEHQQQQGQNHYTHGELEDERHNYPEHHHHSEEHEPSNHDSDEYEKSHGESLAIQQGSSKDTIGVGVNVNIKPPAVDIAITKPVSPIIKPIPPIVNPIPAHKPVVAAVAESLIPIGILPRPILKLNGRLFFGAEVGKNVKVGR